MQKQTLQTPEQIAETLSWLPDNSLLIACIAGVIFGIAWQTYQVYQKTKNTFRIGIIIQENYVRWIMSLFAGLALLIFFMDILIKSFAPEFSAPKFEMGVSFLVGVFGLPIMRKVMKRGQSELRDEAGAE